MAWDVSSGDGVDAKAENIRVRCARHKGQASFSRRLSRDTGGYTSVIRQVSRPQDVMATHPRSSLNSWHGALSSCPFVRATRDIAIFFSMFCRGWGKHASISFTQETLVTMYHRWRLCWLSRWTILVI